MSLTAGHIAQIIAKFPAFDPAWPLDVQAHWFHGFDHLLALEASDSCAGNMGRLMVLGDFLPADPEAPEHG